MLRLLIRSLTYHWRSNLAVMLGVIVGTACLTGALLVGDALRGSMRDLTLERLGRIDVALVSEQLFRAELAEDLRRQPEAGPVRRIAPASLLRGVVLVYDDANQIVKRIGRVQVVGVDERFWPFFDEERSFAAGGVFINQPLAKALNAVEGQTEVVVRIEKPQAIPTDSILGKPVESDDAMVIQRSRVAGIVPDEGSGRFSITPAQQTPLTVFVDLALVQRRLADAGELANAANLLLLESANPDLTDLERALRSAAQMPDYALNLRRDRTEGRYLSLESRRMILPPATVQRVTDLARKNDWEAIPTTTYLANLITRTDRASEEATRGRCYLPYSTITGLDPSLPPPWGPFITVEERKWDRPLRDDEMLLHEWAAEQLWPDRDWQPGVSKVRITYFVESNAVKLEEKQAEFTLAGVLRQDARSVDPTLTPDFPGSHNRRSIQDWKAPFPRDQWHADRWIRPQDNQYWREHQAAPKAFISPARAAELWAGRHGQYTSIRFAKPHDVNMDDFEAVVRERFRDSFTPADFGLALQAVKADGLKATLSGTSASFGWLFQGFSLFLIVSAAMLVGLLFRLGIERRAGEIGLLLAEGFTRRRVRWLLLGEGLLLAAVGAVVGVAAAFGYAYLLIRLLADWWGETLAVSFLRFRWSYFTTPADNIPLGSVVIGYALSVAICLIAILQSLRGLGRFSPRALLHGQALVEPERLTESERASMSQRASGASRGSSFRWLWTLASLIAAVGLAVPGFFTSPADAAPFFFGSGAALLAGGLGLLSLWLRRERGGPATGAGYPALARLGAGNAARNPARSLLTAGLLASAIFLIISVQAFRKTSADEESKDSGTSGFRLIAEADVPLAYVPDGPAAFDAYRRAGTTASQRQALTTLESQVEAGMEVHGFRIRPGEDVSCLNLHQPQRPRILGVPSSFIERGGFAFGPLWKPSETERANPWLILQRDLGGEVPILADDHSAAWVLQKSVGDTWTIETEAGTATVRLVGVLKGSTFQGELLMAGEQFTRLFPSRGRYGYFLLAPSAAQADEAKTALENAFGLDVTFATDRLAAFHAVENTYISTFQVLGGLGLLLGTLGLAVVLLRNVWERRSELALFRALGYSRTALGTMVLAENGLLIVLGILIGAVAALLAIAPQLIGQLANVAWLPMIGLLGLVLFVGLLAGMLAVVSSVRAPLLPALRSE